MLRQQEESMGNISFNVISGVQETFVEIEMDDTQNRILKAYFMSEAEFRERFSGAPEWQIEAAIASARNRPA